MVVKLGTLGGEKEFKTLSWKEFKNSKYFNPFKEKVVKVIKESGEWRTPIERILKGNKYPSVAIIWEALTTDKEVVRVKLSLQREKFKEVLTALGINRLNEVGSGLDFVLFEDDGKIVYGIDKTKLGDGYLYLNKGSYWELTHKDENEKLDFGF